MKKFVFLIFGGLFMIPLTSMAQECYDFESCIPKNIQNACTEQAVNGCIDWDQGIIYAMGTGVPNEKFESAAQRKLSASRAAEITAQRNLLQIIAGVRLDSESTVEAGVLTNDRINTRVQGTLRNSQRIGRPIFDEDGNANVIVRYFMRNLNRIFYSKLKQNKPVPKEIQTAKKESASDSEKSQSNSSDGVYTGLILDARNLDVAPALSPKILDENNQEIYGSAHVERDFSLKYGIVGYAKDTEKAKQNDRVKGNPLVLTPEKSEGKTRTDLVLNQKDAEKLKELYKTQSFLREARVMIVLQ